MRKEESADRGRPARGTRCDGEMDAEARLARIIKLAAHIERNLTGRLTVAGLARLAGCSARSLQATFNELCGLSPMEYVQQRRLSAARTLLEAGDGRSSVSAVALRTGFSHFARFAARYKARYGEPPSLTRRRALKQGRQRRD